MAFTHLRTWSTYYSKSGTGTPEGTSDFHGQIRVYYEQDIPNNRTRIRIDHYAYIWLAEGRSALLRNDYTMMSEYRANNGSFGGTYQRVVRKWPGEGTLYSSSQYVPLTDYVSGSYSTYHWVYHNPDGTARLYVNGKFSALYFNDRTSSFIMDLPTIPRYATITAYTLMPVDFSTLRVNWSANVTCDRVEYKIGSGGWILGQSGDRTSGNFNITGLNPGTQYSITIRVRRKDSQLYTVSSAKNATTVDIARFTNVPDNIDIEQPFTVQFNRNGATKVELTLFSITGEDSIYTSLMPYFEVEGNNYTFELTEAEKLLFYSKMPTVSSKTFRFSIRTNETFTDHAYRNFKVINANPIFNNFTYEDINTDTLDLTDDNQTIIKSHSNLRTIISSENKAIGQKGAGILNYQLVVGEKQKTVPVTLKNIEIGDDLSGKTLYLSFPDDIHSLLSDDTDDTIVGGIENSIFSYTSGNYKGIEFLYNFYDYILYKYQIDKDLISENYLVMQLPNDFGTIEYVNESHPAYQYIKIEDENAINIDINAIDNNVFTVYAIDSRNNSTLKQISPSKYIAYSKVIIANGTAERTGGIGDETTLTFNGTFYNVDFGSSSNSLTITYKYKKTSLPDLEENWVDGTTTITPIINENNFSFEGLIAGDKGALGFDSQYSYNIKIIATDKLSSDEYDLILGTGKPNIAIHRKGTAFGAPYDEELEGFQIVDKKITFNGLELFEWVEEEEEEE